MADKKIKNILFITKNFPPETGGGLRRIEAIYKILLNKENFKLEVVTTVKDNEKKYDNVIYIKQLFFKDKKKENITNFQKTNSYIKLIDKAFIGWLPNVLLYIIFKKFDYVFASAPTFTNIIIGFLFKILKFNKPRLIIEYRDFFSLNPSFVENFEKKILRIFEKIIIKASDYIIVTTSGMRKILTRITGQEKIYLVRNYISSFDIKKINSFKKNKINSKTYNIGYVGKLNTGRNPIKILRLLNHKINRKNIALHFIGVNENEKAFIKNEAKILGLELERIFFRNQVDRNTSLKLMKSFDGVLLLVNSESLIKDGYGIPGKLYDYMYANNNIFSDINTLDNLKVEFKCLVIKRIWRFRKFQDK